VAETTTDTEKTTRRRKWERGKYVPKRKVCAFCADANRVIDYKEPKKLRSFISERGKIEPRRKTGTCARHQRILSVAIKRARHLALLPYVPAHLYRTGGVGIQD
jgi:small subunit ribosomal protein S18